MSTPNHSPYASPRTSVGDIPSEILKNQISQKLNGTLSGIPVNQEEILSNQSNQQVSSIKGLTKIDNSANKLLPPKSTFCINKDGTEDNKDKINCESTHNGVGVNEHFTKTSNKNEEIARKKMNLLLSSLSAQEENVKKDSSLVLNGRCDIVSTPESSSMVKTQQKPVETHLVQSSPVVLNSFKPGGIGSCIPTATNRRQPHDIVKSNLLPPKNSVSPSQDSIKKQMTSPSLSKKRTALPSKTVDRIDHQFAENRRQIDVLTSPLTQRKSTKMNNSSSQSKTLPRRPGHSHSTPLFNKTNSSLNTNIQSEHPCRLDSDEKLIQVNSRRVIIPPRKYSADSLTSGCYSSLPRRTPRSRPHVHNIPVDHYHTLHGHQHVQQQQMNQTQSFGIQSLQDASSKLKEAENLLHDLLMTQDKSENVFDDTTIQFLDHSKAFSRLTSMPNPSLDNETESTFSTFGSPLQTLGSHKQTSSSSLKTFSQTSFYNNDNYCYQSNEASFQSTSTNDDPHSSTPLSPYDEPSSYNKPMFMSANSSPLPPKLSEFKMLPQAAHIFPSKSPPSSLNTPLTPDESFTSVKSGFEPQTQCKFEVCLNKGMFENQFW